MPPIHVAFSENSCGYARGEPLRQPMLHQQNIGGFEELDPVHGRAHDEESIIPYDLSRYDFIGSCGDEMQRSLPSNYLRVYRAYGVIFHRNPIQLPAALRCLDAGLLR